MRKGFSLVELMISVAIVGILAAIAIPELQSMQYRAKRAEALPNLRGISSAATAYNDTFDEWLTGCTTNPGAPLGKQAKPWLEGQPCWSTLGWRPDGEVRCTYYMSTFGGSTSPYARASAECDVDDDNTVAILRHYISTDTRSGYFTDVRPTSY